MRSAKHISVPRSSDRGLTPEQMRQRLESGAMANGHDFIRARFEGLSGADVALFKMPESGTVVRLNKRGLERVLGAAPDGYELPLVQFAQMKLATAQRQAARHKVVSYCKGGIQLVGALGLLAAFATVALNKSISSVDDTLRDSAFAKLPHVEGQPGVTFDKKTMTYYRQEGPRHILSWSFNEGGALTKMCDTTVRQPGDGFIAWVYPKYKTTCMAPSVVKKLLKVPTPQKP